jgi:peptide/nickel transport system permease protein
MAQQTATVLVPRIEDLVDRHERAVRKRQRWTRKVPWPAVIILAVLVFCAAAAPLLAPHEPNTFDLGQKLRPPMWQAGGTSANILGTDSLGRDVFSRLIFGARVSATVVFFAVLSSLAIGVPLGMMAGYFGGWPDALIMRAVDIMLSLPTLLFAALLATAFAPGLRTVIVVISAFSWMGYARIVRGQILSLKERDYVALARIAGASPARVLWSHMLPQIVSTLVILASLEIGSVIAFEATLSFLGFGVVPPTATWGSMLSDGRKYIVDAWWLAVTPGVTIAVVILSVNLMGDWLRDTLDPRLRQT